MMGISFHELAGAPCGSKIFPPSGTVVEITPCVTGADCEAICMAWVPTAAAVNTRLSETLTGFASAWHASTKTPGRTNRNSLLLRDIFSPIGDQKSKIDNRKSKIVH
jgi:hypothetical protein